MHSLRIDKPVDLFGLRPGHVFLEPLLDAEYGAASYVRVSRPTELELRVATTGLMLRETVQAPRQRNILVNLIVFLVTTLAAFVAGFAGLGWIGGRDIGFAGAALWYAVVPAAAIGMLVALLVGFLASKNSWARRGLFFTASLAATFGAAALAMQGFIWASHRSWDPEFEYVPAAGNVITLSLTVPAEAAVGEQFIVYASRDWGKSWERVPYRGGHPEGRFTEHAPKFERDAADQMTWKTDPPLPPEEWAVNSIVGDRRTLALTIRRTGTYRMWTETTHPFTAKSDAVIITVRPK